MLSYIITIIIIIINEMIKVA